MLINFISSENTSYPWVINLHEIRYRNIAIVMILFLGPTQYSLYHISL